MEHEGTLTKEVSRGIHGRTGWIFTQQVKVYLDDKGNIVDVVDQFRMHILNEILSDATVSASILLDNGILYLMKA